MELQHTFTVPAPLEQAWSTLLDVEGVAPCFPGARLTGVEGDEFSGTVKVKLGPVSLLYAGKGRFVERDEAARRVVLEANGSDKRGNGTAGARVHARLEPDRDGATRVVVHTDLKVTGRPAQFGRGMLQDVGGRIIEQFAACLAKRMSAPATAPEPAAQSTSVPASVAVGEAASVPAGEPASVPAGEGEATTAADNPDAAVPAANDPALATHQDLGGAEGAGATPRPADASGSGSQRPAAELDLGAVVVPVLARRYGPAVLAGLVAVLVVWLLRRRAH